jgi:hypothetical protein
MPTIDPLPIEIAIPEIPSELPEKDKPKWTTVRPGTWLHPPIPLEIEFPLLPPKTVLLPLRIKIPGKGIFEVNLALTALERAQSGT